MSLGWLTARPVAHRGLHDRARGIVENTASAAKAAIQRGFGIECDVQRTADGDAVVFHDFALERLTADGQGAMASLTAAQAARLGLRDTADRVMRLDDFLALVGGQVPLIVEVKSAFDGDMRLTDRTAAAVADYAGPLVLKSFDPQVIAHLRGHAALGGRSIPRGIVAEASYDGRDYARLSPERRRALAEFLFFDDARPDFISYRAADLPRAAPHLCRTAMGLPVLGWTIRSPDQSAAAKPWVDQIIFEGFDPAG